MTKLLTASFALFFHVITYSQVLKPKGNRPYKVIGYYLLNALIKDSINREAEYGFLDYVTHVNIAFINPDTTGNFRHDLPIRKFISQAHSKNVRVLPSIAGGGRHTYYAALLREENRKLLVANLVSLVNEYDFDGVDVDIEGNDIDSNYEAFVRELATALKPLSKTMTAAIATVYKDKLSDSALQQFDFLNIMSYDRTGPWNPRKQGHHSPYEMAREDLEYWNKTRKISKERLVLGLPFYGYGFGSPDSAVTSMNFREIAALQANAASVDSLSLTDMRTMYYNGIGTIKKKTELASEKAGGVMIWQLSGDAPGENSLLKTIFYTLYKGNNLITQ